MQTILNKKLHANELEEQVMTSGITCTAKKELWQPWTKKRWQYASVNIGPFSCSDK
ncbi:hypothetical protein HBH73_211490 [Parastagonospora nodorum]|nr:hypothetical protein HBH73_211490 [Parastagonospora nodorum]